VAHENICTTVEEQKVKEGWLGKPKGMLQVLWERGWIDSSKVVTARSLQYSKDGKKEDFGEDGKLKEASQQYALSYLLQQCTDFKNEKSDLEHLAAEKPDATRQYSSCLPPSIIANWLVKGSNTAGAQPNGCIKSCHSIRKSLGSPSGRVLLCASAK
jgi:hypothetical protein